MRRTTTAARVVRAMGAIAIIVAVFAPTNAGADGARPAFVASFGPQTDLDIGAADPANSCVVQTASHGTWLAAAVSGEFDGVVLLELVNGSLVQRQRIALPVTWDDPFGHDMTMNDQWLVLPNPADDVVHTFELVNGTWIRRDDITGSAAYYGLGAAFIGPERVLIGAYEATDAGHIDVYERSGGAWTLTGSFGAGLGNGFPGSITVADGEILASAPIDSQLLRFDLDDMSFMGKVNPPAEMLTVMGINLKGG